jgi:hypothetical protein
MFPEKISYSEVFPPNEVADIQRHYEYARYESHKWLKALIFVFLLEAMVQFHVVEDCRRENVAEEH